MENYGYGDVIGSSQAPYINGLATTYGLATNYFAVSHPSLPNYIAATSGATQGITDDNGPSSDAVNVPSIFSQLPPGQSRSLEEGMPPSAGNALGLDRLVALCLGERSISGVIAFPEGHL